MKTVKVWIIRVIIIALLVTAVIKSPTAFVAALLGVILAGYLLFLWLKWKFWRLLAPFSDMGAAMNERSLTLQKSVQPFHNPAQVNAALETLKQNGFNVLGTYSAKQISRASIVVANHQAEATHAIIMDLEFMGVTTEFCSKYVDGKTFTCSNTKMPAVLPRPDTHPILRFPNSSAQAVLDQFKQSRPSSGFCPIADADILAQIVAQYSEIKSYELDTLNQTANHEAQLLENFIIASGWSAIEWHRKQNDVLIIHDGIKDYELISKFESAIDDEDEQYRKLKRRAESITKNNPPLVAFQLLSAELPTKIQLKKIHELAEPIPAHVYLIERPAHSKPTV